MQIDQNMIRDFLRDKVSAVEIMNSFLKQAFDQIEDPAEAIAEADALSRRFIHVLAEETRRTLSPARLTESQFWRIDKAVASHRVPLYCDLREYIDGEIKKRGLASR